MRPGPVTITVTVMALDHRVSGSVPVPGRRGRAVAATAAAAAAAAAVPAASTVTDSEILTGAVTPGAGPRRPAGGPDSEPGPGTLNHVTSEL
jgi:hypothetical protein